MNLISRVFARLFFERAAVGSGGALPLEMLVFLPDFSAIDHSRIFVSGKSKRYFKFVNCQFGQVRFAYSRMYQHHSRDLIIKDALAELARYEKPLATLAPQIVEVESALALETLSVEQDKGSKKLDGQANVVETRRIVWLESTPDLIAALDAVAPAHSEMGQVAGFLRNARGEVEMALDVGVPNLRAFVDAIRDGHMPIPKDAPVIETKPLALAKPKVTAVFATHALTWIDENGSQRIVGKWRDVELPEVAATFALQVRLAVLPSDPMCAKSRGQSPGHPEVSWLNNLDTKVGPNIPGNGEGTSAFDPINGGPFTVVDRGAAIQMKVAR
jgi:hypothetical protein